MSGASLINKTTKKTWREQFGLEEFREAHERLEFSYAS